MTLFERVIYYYLFTYVAHIMHMGPSLSAICAFVDEFVFVCVGSHWGTRVQFNIRYRILREYGLGHHIMTWGTNRRREFMRIGNENVVSNKQVLC